MRVTEKEIEAMVGIVESDYIDGDHPVNRPVWTWSANPWGSPQKFGGVVNKLLKKGLVQKLDAKKSKDRCLLLTASGFAVLKEKRPQAVARWE